MSSNFSRSLDLTTGMVHSSIIGFRGILDVLLCGVTNMGQTCQLSESPLKMRQLGIALMVGFLSSQQYFPLNLSRMVRY